jgi:CPA1 family monovalent cation:H+ antiporter
MLRAAYESLDNLENEIALRLQGEFSEMLRRVDGTGELSAEARSTENELRARARNAARERLMELRQAGTIGDSAFQLLEEEIDFIDLDAEVRSRW